MLTRLKGTDSVSIGSGSEFVVHHSSKQTCFTFLVFRVRIGQCLHESSTHTRDHGLGFRAYRDTSSASSYTAYRPTHGTKEASTKMRQSHVCGRTESIDDSLLTTVPYFKKLPPDVART